MVKIYNFILIFLYDSIRHAKTNFHPFSDVEDLENPLQIRICELFHVQLRTALDSGSLVMLCCILCELRSSSRQQPVVLYFLAFCEEFPLSSKTDSIHLLIMNMKPIVNQINLFILYILAITKTTIFLATQNLRN